MSKVEKGNFKMTEEIIKLAMNQSTYDSLSSYDKDTYYFIDNSLQDGEIKNVYNYLLSSEVAEIRKILKG